jgi:hypothetical protein
MFCNDENVSYVMRLCVPDDGRDLPPISPLSQREKEEDRGFIHARKRVASPDLARTIVPDILG